MNYEKLPVIDNKRTGNKIKVIMQQKHVSVSQLQIALEMSSATNIYKWLRGEFIPSTNKLVQIARILDCTVDDLLITQED